MNYRPQLLVIVFLLCCTSVIYAGSKKISFSDSSWEEVLAQSKKSGKIIFVEGFAPYCQPCKNMEATVFTDPNVADYYNKNFINYKVDINTHDGQMFKIAYDVKYLPSYLFFSPQGEVILREQGQFTSEGMIRVGEKAQNQRPIEKIVNKVVEIEEEDFHEYSTDQMDDVYYSGNRSLEFLFEYAHRLKEEGRNYTAVVQQYLVKRKKTNKDVREIQFRTFIMSFANELESPAFGLLIKDLDFFRQQYKHRKVNDVIRAAVQNSVVKAADQQDKKLFNRCVKLVEKTGVDKSGQFKIQMEKAYFEGTGEWEKFAKAVDKEIKNSHELDQIALNQDCWKILDNQNDKKLLSKTKKWTKKSLKVEEKYYNNETMAFIMYRLKKSKKANQAAMKAKSIGIQKGIGIYRLQRLNEILS